MNIIHPAGRLALLAGLACGNVANSTQVRVRKYEALNLPPVAAHRQPRRA